MDFHAVGGENMTVQMKAAKLGELTSEMRLIAKEEKISED